MMSTRIGPSANRVAISTEPAETGIFPHVETDSAVSVGTVISIGHDVQGVVAGQRVAFLDEACHRITIGDENSVIVHVDDILAIV